MASEQTTSRQTTVDTVSVVTDHYNQKKETQLESRPQSYVIHLRSFNNWIKTCSLQESKSLQRRGCVVLDLSCGKGGDLDKFKHHNIAHYVGGDISKESIDAATVRVKDRRPPYRVTLFVADCHQPLPDHRLSYDFDLVSCQFALHYAFQSEERIRGLLYNVTRKLKTGGEFVCTIPDSRVLCHLAADSKSFGNSIYSVTFDDSIVDVTTAISSNNTPYGHRYIFWLRDCIDHCPEFLVPLPTLLRLAKEYGLECVGCRGFQQQFVSSSTAKEQSSLLTRMRVVDAKTRQLQLSRDEWEVCYLYCSLTFLKNGVEATIATES